MNSSTNSLALILVLTAGIAFLPFTHAADSYALVLQQEELTTTDGLQQVHARMLQAAKDYCPTYLQIRSRADVATCIEGVVEDLTAKIADERLTNYVAAINRSAGVDDLVSQVAR